MNIVVLGQLISGIIMLSCGVAAIPVAERWGLPPGITALAGLIIGAVLGNVVVYLQYRR